MRMSNVRAIVALSALAVLSSCGGSESTGVPNPGGSTGGTFKATIDGTAWTSSATQVTAQAGGTFIITGYQLGNGVSQLLTLYNIGGTGTFPIGVGPTVPGGTASVVSGASSWLTPLSGAAGTVTISALTTARIAGTFSYTAPVSLGQSGASKVVTAGQFDIPISTLTTTTIPDKAGSSLTGTIAGNAFTAATIVTVAPPSSGTLTLGASNTAYNVNMILSGYTGAGSYTLGTGASRTLQVSIPGSATQSWGSTNATSSGTVVITSATATRIKGTISATLAASPGFSGSAITVSGTFDMGVP